MIYLHEQDAPVANESLTELSKYKTGLWPYLAHGRPANLVAAPVLYFAIIPFALLDLYLILYQLVCFPIYGIARVPRKEYFV